MDQDLNKKKRELRKYILRLRRNLSQDVIKMQSAAILRHVINSPQYEAAVVIMIYVAMRDEVQTFTLIEHSLKQGKQVCVPYINDRAGNMDAILIRSLDELVKGDFDILTAVKSDLNLIDPMEINLMIMPGVAFDQYGHRLGMGAGFYDRFMVQAKQASSLGLVLSCQLLDIVPCMPHDYLVDYIVTEDGIINCKTGKM